MTRPRVFATIMDDFLSDPKTVKKLCDEMPMMDYMASDNITYPGIIELPKEVRIEIEDRFRKIYGGFFKPKLMFGRYSMADMDPPNWAHSDGNMASMIALIYLSDPMNRFADKAGTYFLKHKTLGFSLHPVTEGQMRAINEESNDRDRWEKTFYCPSKWNRCFIYDAPQIHAAGMSYGLDRETARFVVTVFFDLRGDT